MLPSLLPIDTIEIPMMGELWDNVFSRSHHDNFCASKGHKNYNVTDCLQAKTFTKEVIIQHFLINLAIAFQASKLIDHPIEDILAKLQKRGCFKLKSCFTLHKIITSLQCSCCGTLGNTNSRRVSAARKEKL